MKTLQEAGSVARWLLMRPDPMTSTERTIEEYGAKRYQQEFGHEAMERRRFAYAAQKCASDSELAARRAELRSSETAEPSDVEASYRYAVAAIFAKAALHAMYEEMES